MSQSSLSDKLARSVISRTPTPTKPLYPGKIARASSVANSQNVAGSLKTGGLGTITHWKARMEDDIIPSDDSDPGDKSPFGHKSRTRIRKRRVTRGGQPLPASGGMPSWLSQRSVSVSSNAIVSPNRPIADNANLAVGRKSSYAKPLLFSPPVNDQNNDDNQNQANINPGDNIALNSNGSLAAQNNQTDAEGPSFQDKMKQGVTNKVLISNGTSQSSRPIPSQNSRREISRNILLEDWIFYTVWFPAWDIIWKCNNGKVPLRKNKSFCRLIKEIIFDNTGPDLHGTYNLSVMRVQIPGNASNDYKTTGILQTDPPRTKRKVDWKPFPTMGKLIEVVTSRADIIVQCTPKNPPASISKRKTCIVHLTPKDGNNMDFHGLLNPSDVQLAIYSIEYDHYCPRIVKCSPYWGNSLHLREIEHRQLPQASPATNLGALAVENIPPITPSPVFEVAHLSQIVEESPLLSTRLSRFSSTPFVAENDEIQEVIDDVSITSSPIHVPMEGRYTDEESCSDIYSGTTNSSSPNIQSASNEFSLEDFFRNGAFVPGPLRPKVKKTSGEVYQYHTLAQLRLMLQASIKDDVERNVVPNMMVKCLCHTFGVVVEVVSQFRHENAHYVRISDETRKSVLLRIHSDAKDNGPGPTIEIGNIIRIHRLTVQMEWDVDAGKNTMVLSTFAQRNYVLFEQSNEEYQFYFNTCAKTITLTENDNKRVGELHLFKLVLAKSSKKGDKQTPYLCISEGHEASNVQVDVPSISSNRGDNENQSEGIYDSDLASPPSTLTNDFVEANPINFAESPMSVDDRNSQRANSHSDESFFSATGDIIEPDNPVNFTSDSHNTNQVQEELELEQPPDERQISSFTLFKNLVKTVQPFAFLCQIVTLCGSLDGKEWNLTVRDLERTVPSEDFKLNQPVFVNQQRCDDCLVINITNAEVFEDQNILSMLYEAQGSDEVFSIEKVKVIGVSPPYGLQISSDVCEIKKYSYFNEIMDSYSERMNNTNVSIDTPRSWPEVVTLSDEESINPPNENIAEVVALNQAEVSGAENIGDDANMDSEKSPYETAKPSPSHSPVRAFRKRSIEGTSEEEKWTGRLKHKRKPREHYQPEDSFEC